MILMSEILMGNSAARIRLTAPRETSVQIRYLDSVHAAIVNAWCAAGAHSQDVIGPAAQPWSFGSSGLVNRNRMVLKSLVIGAEGNALPGFLAHMTPNAISKESSNGDRVDLSGWEISVEPLPVLESISTVAAMPIIMLSPLAISVKGQKGRWHTDLKQLGQGLGQAVNTRLSRLTGRIINLNLEPDQLYLRANPRHSALVCTRSVPGKNPAFVLGMVCPMTISGSVEDLNTAWTLGIGEKNRYGFGCIGSAGATL